MVSVLAATLAFMTPAMPPTDAGKFICQIPDGTLAKSLLLRQTTVDAQINGFGAAVTVTQTFRNPNRSAVEAVYTFPLPENAAVDQMRMQIGDRVIEGDIARREDARRTYEAAKAAGQMASLLDQERGNIFTQSVANLMPGAEVKVQIRYVQVLNYLEGEYEFNFPMTVGPIFTGPNTPDPGKISPPRMRTGAGISLNVQIEGGARLQKVHSVLHEIDVNRSGEDRATVTLRRADEIPNRDFILRYAMTGNSVQPALLSNFDPKRGGTFALFMMPPKSVPANRVRPKEMIFVMDQSGSQQGFPLEKSKELTLKLLRKMGPNDTFNVLGFSNDVRPLWTASRRNTPAALREAEEYVKSMTSDGGTELEKALVAIHTMPVDPERLRMVVFNTDGYAGQEPVILREVQRNQSLCRMFVFGIGNGVNRALIDAMAVMGRGDQETVTLAESADGAVDRLYRRLNSPVLTQVSATAEGISDLTPRQLPDVFLERPVVVFGRYTKPGPATITIQGTQGDGTTWSRQLDVQLSGTASAPVLPSLWARQKLQDIEVTNYARQIGVEESKAAVEDPERLALDYRLMSSYTSFVAVEKRVVNVGGKQYTVRVPVEMTDGVSMLREKDVRYQNQASGTIAMTKAVSASPAYGGLGGGGRVQVQANRSEESAKAVQISKFSPELRQLRGEIAVQITLSLWNPETLERLAAAGLRIDVKEPRLKVVFGRLDVAKLDALAAITEVQRISKL